MRRERFGQAIAWLIAVAALVPAAAAAGELPSPSCLAALRSARIARMSDEPAAEMERLAAAGPLCADRLELTAALLDYDRRHGLPDEAHRDLHSRLLARLEDPDFEVSAAVASHLIWEPDLDSRVLAAVAGSYRRRIASQEKPSLRSLRTLADLLERLERLEEAAAVLERVSTLDAGETADWRLRSLYQRLERWRDLARVLERIIGRGDLQARLFRPELIRLLVRLGDRDQALGQLELLEQERSGALGSSQVEPEFYLELAWELRDARQDTEAERLFRKALVLPQRTAPSLTSGLGARTENVAEQARRALVHFYAGAEEREALIAEAKQEQQSTDPFALYEAGTQELTSGRLAEAYELLARAAPAIGDLEAAWHNLALVCYRLEKWSEAAEAYGRARSLNPDRAEAWFFEGLARVNLEQCRLAVEPLKKALELDPERALAHYHLSRCYYELGDRESADRHREAWVQSQGNGGGGR